VRKLLRLAKYVTEDPGRTPEEFCGAARRAAVHLPNSVAEFLRRLLSFRLTQPARCSSPACRSMTRLRRPADNQQHLGQSHHARAHAGHPERVPRVDGGLRGRGVAGGSSRTWCPDGRPDQRRRTSLGSAIELQVHTEQAFSDLRPDYLSLACLRDDPVREHVHHHREGTRQPVHSNGDRPCGQPRWTTTIDASFRGQGHDFEAGLVRGPMPVFYGAS